jgi:hypothetical protein
MFEGAFEDLRRNISASVLHTQNFKRIFIHVGS